MSSLEQEERRYHNELDAFEQKKRKVMELKKTEFLAKKRRNQPQQRRAPHSKSKYSPTQFHPSSRKSTPKSYGDLLSVYEEVILEKECLEHSLAIQSNYKEKNEKLVSVLIKENDLSKSVSERLKNDCSEYKKQAYSAIVRCASLENSVTKLRKDNYNLDQNKIEKDQLIFSLEKEVELLKLSSFEIKKANCHIECLKKENKVLIGELDKVKQHGDELKRKTDLEGKKMGRLENSKKEMEDYVRSMETNINELENNLSNFGREKEQIRREMGQQKKVLENQLKMKDQEIKNTIQRMGKEKQDAVVQNERKWQDQLKQKDMMLQQALQKKDQECRSIIQRKNQQMQQGLSSKDQGMFQLKNKTEQLGRDLRGRDTRIKDLMTKITKVEQNLDKVWKDKQQIGREKQQLIQRNASLNREISAVENQVDAIVQQQTQELRKEYAKIIAEKDNLIKRMATQRGLPPPEQHTPEIRQPTGRAQNIRDQIAARRKQQGIDLSPYKDRSPPVGRGRGRGMSQSPIRGGLGRGRGLNTQRGRGRGRGFGNQQNMRSRTPIGRGRGCTIFDKPNPNNSSLRGGTQDIKARLMNMGKKPLATSSLLPPLGGNQDVGRGRGRGMNPMGRGRGMNPMGRGRGRGMGMNQTPQSPMLQRTTKPEPPQFIDRGDLERIYQGSLAFMRNSKYIQAVGIFNQLGSVDRVKNEDKQFLMQILEMRTEALTALKRYNDIVNNLFLIVKILPPGNEEAGFGVLMEISKNLQLAGDSFASKSDYGKAMENYNKALNLINSIPEVDGGLRNDVLSNAFESRGNLYLEMRDYRNAIQDFIQLSIVKDDYKTFYNLGVCFYELKEYQIGLDFLNKSIAANRKFHGAYHYQGLIHMKHYEFDEAARAFGVALSFNSLHEPSRKLKAKMDNIIKSVAQKKKFLKEEEKNKQNEEKKKKKEVEKDKKSEKDELNQIESRRRKTKKKRRGNPRMLKQDINQYKIVDLQDFDDYNSLPLDLFTDNRPINSTLDVGRIIQETSNSHIYDINFNAIEPEKCVGVKTSSVFKGTLNGTPVIIKIYPINYQLQQQIFIDFEKHFAFYKNLNKRNVLKIYGFSLQQNKIGLVTEYCQYGTLKEFLVENGYGLKLNDKLDMLYKIAEAVRYFHANGRTVKHLTLNKIYIAAHLEPKIIDEDFTAIIDKISMTKHYLEINCDKYYRPPEFSGNQIADATTLKVDSWLFGILMYEILFLRKLDYVSIKATVPFKINQRLIKNASIGQQEKWIVKLIKQCTHNVPRERPSFNMIVETLVDEMYIRPVGSDM